MLDTLLRTKLYVPPLRPNMVRRSRLIERLNQGLQLGHKLTLISAPAGFGKTTLLCEWVAAGSQPAPWLSLDEGDNDPTRFLTYLVAALQTLPLSNVEGSKVEVPALSYVEGNNVEGPAANFGEKVLGLLQSPQPPSSASILTALLNEITALPHNFILVLDDYHVIDAQPVDASTSVDEASTSVDRALNFLLEYLPPNMHLVIATRDDPQLPLARLRARGQLTELRANDLRFAPDEAAAFLNQMMDLNLSAEEIAALENRTEGWITGLQLAAISLQGYGDAAGFIQSFTGSHRFVLDYLLEEVLHQQSESVRGFLLQTSILDRLCGPLCDAVRFGETPGKSAGTAVTGQEDGRKMLQDLERGNLFVIPLDDRRHWYRYHHLFADVLQARLMDEHPDQVPVLHHRASEWYERRDRPSDAIRHALAAQDFERTAGLAEQAWPAMSGSFQSIAWLGWLKNLPDEFICARPVLCVSYAWAYLNAGNLEAAEARLLDAERWLEPTAGMKDDPAAKMIVSNDDLFRSLPVSLASARAYLAQAAGDLPGAMKYAQQVLDLVPEESPNWRSDATALLGLAHWASGDLMAAHQAFFDGLSGMKPLEFIVGTLVLAEIKATLGHLDEAISTCENALQLASEHGEPIGTEDVYSAISALHRERGDLETAAQDLAACKALGDQVELPDWQYRWCIAQARLSETMGDLDNALYLLDEAERLYVRTPLPVVRPIEAMKVRVWVKQGRVADALAWARERGLFAADVSFLREFEHITLARALIAKYQRDHEAGSIHDAVRLLERLLQAAEEGQRTGSVIEILVLVALAYHAQDDTLRALDPLERAMTLAAPQGYVQIFIDEGPPMTQLLSAAAAQGVMPDYSGKLLAAFPTARPEQTEPSKTHSEFRILNSELIEPLSERELEVLALIAEGLTNQEIATRLYISLNTVKVHTRNINGKLGANNRMQAAAKARALGILPPT